MSRKGQMMRACKTCQSRHSAASPGMRNWPAMATKLATMVIMNRFPGGHSSIRNAYRVRMIPARQNPSKNLSVLNIVTFTDSATVSPKMRMKMTENNSTGRRPTLADHVLDEASADAVVPRVALAI